MVTAPVELPVRPARAWVQLAGPGGLHLCPLGMIGLIMLLMGLTWVGLGLSLIAQILI